jgi:uncharacterized protein YegL
MAKDMEKSVDGISRKRVRRSLHFFWIIDWSGSMANERIQKVNYAIRNVLPEIRKAEENERINIYMRAIKFASIAEWHIGPEPIPVSRFNWVDMDASKYETSTTKAVDMLTAELDIANIGKRNVPPVAILLSDGRCTDEPESLYYEAINRLNQSPWGKKAVRLSIGIGDQTNDYNKEQLDSFISPYLRLKQGVETFPASDTRLLIRYIQAASLAATRASSQSQGEGDDPDSPVILPKIDISDEYDGPDFSKLSAGDVF